ncbi:hypothetical protein Tco_1428301 [Tanacetum coccineum]
MPRSIADRKKLAKPDRADSVQVYRSPARLARLRSATKKKIRAVMEEIFQIGRRNYDAIRMKKKIDIVCSLAKILMVNLQNDPTKHKGIHRFPTKVARRLIKSLCPTNRISKLTFDCTNGCFQKGRRRRPCKEQHLAVLMEEVLKIFSV